jgi:hypothetical protein
MYARANIEVEKSWDLKKILSDFQVSFSLRNSNYFLPMKRKNFLIKSF